MRWRGARLINFIKLISAAAEGRGLVYWIMDDGSLQNKGLHLNTYGFTQQDIFLLKTTLGYMFGENTLKCSIHKHQKKK